MADPNKRDRKMAADLVSRLSIPFGRGDETRREIAAEIIAAARAEGEARGRRKVSEAAAAIVSQHPSEHPQCEDFRGCCELMEEQIAALAEPPADGSGA